MIEVKHTIQNATKKYLRLLGKCTRLRETIMPEFSEAAVYNYTASSAAYGYYILK